MASITTSGLVAEQFEVKPNSEVPLPVAPAVPLRTRQERMRTGSSPAGIGLPTTGGYAAPLDFSLCSRMECLAAAPLFRGLSRSECSEMASAARERRFGSNNALFREGEGVEFVFLIARGWVKITQLSRSGKEVILRVNGRGEVIDGIGSFPRAAHADTAETMDVCHVLTWDVKMFSSFVKRFPVLPINASCILEERLRKLEARFRDLATEPVTQRLARLLLNLYEQSYGTTHDLHIALSCEELAQMSGTTLFTVSRLLSDWQQQEIICRDRKTVVVKNLATLIAIAEGC